MFGLFLSPVRRAYCGAKRSQELSAGILPARVGGWGVSPREAVLRPAGRQEIPGSERWGIQSAAPEMVSGVSRVGAGCPRFAPKARGGEKRGKIGEGIGFIYRESLGFGSGNLPSYKRLNI